MQATAPNLTPNPCNWLYNIREGTHKPCKFHELIEPTKFPQHPESYKGSFTLQ